MKNSGRLRRNQGHTRQLTGDVEIAVVQRMLLAYDTDLRLQNEGVARPFMLEEWIVDAGPDYFFR